MKLSKGVRFASTYAGLFVCVGVASACGANGGASEASPGGPDGASATSVDGIVKAASTEVATVTLETGHSVRFIQFEDESGHVGISALEEGLIGQSPRLSGQEQRLNATALFRYLSPGAQAPDALVAAETRSRSAARASVTQRNADPSLEPPAEPAAAGPGPRLYTAGDQAFAFSAFCQGDHTYECLQGFDWASSRTFNTWNYAFWVVVGSEAPRSGNYRLNQWQCRGVFGGSCAWRDIWDYSVHPGTWMHWWFAAYDSTQVYFRSELSAVGGQPQSPIGGTVTIADGAYYAAGGSANCGPPPGPNTGTCSDGQVVGPASLASF